jgi:cold-inducible RNA-binding protein
MKAIGYPFAIFAEILYMKLFIAGFPNDFDDADIKDMFELYGAVTSAGFVTDRATGKSKGFGFVEMPDNAEALETIGILNGTKIKGKQISVQKAEERSGNSKPRNNFNKRY